MTAHQESNESKDAQKDAWHVSRLFVFILFHVNLLQADGTMAKDRLKKGYPEGKPLIRFARCTGQEKGAERETGLSRRNRAGAQAQASTGSHLSQPRLARQGRFPQ
jgi:hypothetical protein